MATVVFRWWRSWRLLSIIMLLGFALWRWNLPQRDSRWSLATAQPIPEGTFFVEAVIDGDTLRVVPRGNHTANAITVRLLGINAPEDTTKREPFGPEATAFLREQVAGKEVYLEWDKRRIDKFGRRLAYVYRGDVMLNQALVRQGLARVFSYPGDNMTVARDLSRAQDAAEKEGLGIWSKPLP